MRWIYFGTGLLSARLLTKLLTNRFTPSLVITGSPKPSGRGRKISHTPVFMVAHKYGVPVIETTMLNDPVILRKIKTESPSFYVVFDFGHKVPPELLKIPRIAPLNIHPSLLPAYRGAAPIIRAMMAGERKTGVTIIIMNEEIDKGDIVLQEEVEIDDEMTRGELEELLLDKATDLIPKAFDGLKKGTITPRPQEEKGSYAKKLKRDELWIKWEDRAINVKNLIHALSPVPGARSMFKDKIIQFLRAKIPEETFNLKPGEIFVKGKRLFIGTGDGILEILILKPSGKKEMPASEFINGYRPHGLYFTSR